MKGQRAGDPSSWEGLAVLKTLKWASLQQVQWTKDQPPFSTLEGLYKSSPSNIRTQS